MRYGIFSDVHSNLEALEAVITAYQTEAIDEYLCVGDIVGYGANPCECLQRVRGMVLLSVAGNHDWGSCDLFNTDYFNAFAKRAVFWTRERLRQEERDYLRSLKLVFEKDNFILVHSMLIHPEEFRYMQDGGSVYTSLEVLSNQVLFIGHTHKAGIFIKNKEGVVYYTKEPAVKIIAGSKYIINVGSVGQPRDGNPQAAYCIFDTAKKQIEIKRSPYDIKAAQDKIIRVGLPRFLADRLTWGR
jgi:predicted phosphodiesterase